MLTSACTQASDTTVPMTTRPTPEQNVPYSQVWSAEPGIDLFGRGAELVRASLEAGQYAALYSIGTTFPGYLESFGDRRRIDGSEIWTDLVPNGSGNGGAGPWTTRYHIADLTETPTEITAEVCDDEDKTTSVTRPEQSWVGFSWVVSLRNTGDTPGLPGIPDTSPETSDPRARRVPDWNVFDSWRITQLRTGGRDRNTAAPACTDWWLQRYPGSTTVDGYVHIPAGTVTPGLPVAQQYPEWIGPAQPQ